jgi:hypothetical protein
VWQAVAVVTTTRNQRPQVLPFCVFLRLFAAEKSSPEFDASALPDLTIELPFTDSMRQDTDLDFP